MDNKAQIVLEAHFGHLSKLSQDPIIAGSVKTLSCRVKFTTNDWNQMSKKMVVFAKGKIQKTTPIEDIFPPLMLDNNNEIIIPANILNYPSFSISAIGMSDEGKKITTNWLVFDVENGAVSDGMASEEIVQTVYENIINNFNSYYTKSEADAKFLSEEEIAVFSPTITENKDNTNSIYKLDITNIDNQYTTPNLRGSDGYTPKKGIDYDDGIGISNISYYDTSESGGINQLSIIMTDGRIYNFSIKNGETGKDGVGIDDISYYPSSESGGENQLNILMTNGQLYNFYIKNGEKGLPGASGSDGYTPIRGIDYWTDEDKTEIKKYVDDAILGGAW